MLMPLYITSEKIIDTQVEYLGYWSNYWLNWNLFNRQVESYNTSEW